MDARTDGPYSRAPEFEDLLKLCRALNQEGAEYLVIGGFAVILHGGGRSTKDVDLLVRETEENVRKIKKAMSILPDNAAALVNDDDVAQHQVVRVADEFIVDLMASACGLRYEDLKDLVVFKEIEDVRIPVLGVEGLLKTKVSWRDIDKADSLFLRELLRRQK